MKLNIGKNIINDETRLILVSHMRPDADCIAAIYLFLFALDRVPGDPNCRFVFVPHGSRFTEPVASDEVVVHFDTGRVLDADQLIFDHHFIGTKYVSATHAVYATLLSDLELPQAITDMVTYLDLADSGGRVGRITDADLSLVKAASRSLRDEGVPGKFVPDYVGPTVLSKFVQSFPSSLDDQARMLFGLFLLDGYCEKYRPRDPLWDAKVKICGNIDAPASNGVTEVATPESVTSALPGRVVLPKAEKFELVLPLNFGLDEVVAVNLLLQSLQLPIGSPNVRFFFTIRGPLVHRASDENTAVIHLGAGGRYAPDEWILDPVASDFPFASVTAAVAQLFLGWSRASSEVKDIVKFINFYCGTSTERCLSVRQLMVVESLYHELALKIQHPVRFKRFSNAPLFLLESFGFLPSYLSCDQRLMIMQLISSGYLEQEATHDRILSFVGDSNIIDGRGVRVACIATNSYEKRDLRSVMKSFQSRVDVYVAEFETGLDESTDRKFTVTVMNRRKQIRGMERLVEEIFAMDPGLSRDSQDDVYLHHDRFLLYVGSRTNLTLEEMLNLTIKNLEAGE